MSVLCLKDINKSFVDSKNEIKVLENISFSLKENEKIAIVGPSGCGKSTLLNIISGLIKSDSGQVLTKGKIGYMFQQDNLFPWRNVYKNITIGLEIKGKIKKEDKDRILKLLEKYGLKEFIYKYPSELSGGMRQRCALIRTLVLNPDILLLDEPFSALDAQTRILVNEDIYKIVSKEKKAVIMVTHDISEAISFSDRVIVLSSRPSKIKKIYEISFPSLKERTPLNVRGEDEFKTYFDSIWRDLNEN